MKRKKHDELLDRFMALPEEKQEAICRDMNRKLIDHFFWLSVSLLFCAVMAEIA